MVDGNDIDAGVGRVSGPDIGSRQRHRLASRPRLAGELRTPLLKYRGGSALDSLYGGARGASRGRGHTRSHSRHAPARSAGGSSLLVYALTLKRGMTVLFLMTLERAGPRVSEVRGSGRGMGGPPPDQSRLLLPPRQGIGCRKCVAVREFLNIIKRFFCNTTGFCGSSCGTPVPSAVLTKK